MSVTLAPAVDLDKVKMKWQELYVSEGLNRKVIPSAERGIYRGLRLAYDSGQGGGERKVNCEPDPNSGDHEALYQSTDGFSLSYRDDSIGTMNFDLGDAQFDNTDTVVALLMDYQIGVDTTAQFIAYPVAEFDALPAGVRDELIVLGTVAVGGPGINIPVGAMGPDRRTMPWMNRAPGDIEWFPIIRNGDFEIGTAASSGNLAVPYFERSSANISYKTIDTDQNTGLKCLELRSQSGGNLSGDLLQFLNVPVQPGQWVRLQYFKKNLVVPSSGDVELLISWAGPDGVVSLNESRVIDTSVVDGSFVKVESMFEVPVNVGYLTRVSFGNLGSLVTGSGVAFLLIDDFQIWLEAKGPLAQVPVPRGSEVSAYPLLLPDRLGDENDNKANLSFDKDSPSGEGSIIVERFDRVATSLPPALKLLGRMVNLGDNLLDDVAEALIPRISGEVRDTVAELTLIQQWDPGSVTNGKVRMYVLAEGGYQITVNARWDGALWNKDITGAEASRMRQNHLGIIWDYRSTSATPWAEGTWDNTMDLDLSAGTLRTDGARNTTAKCTAGSGIRGDASNIVATVGSFSSMDYQEMHFCRGSNSLTTSGYMWPGFYPGTSPSSAAGKYWRINTGVRVRGFAWQCQTACSGGNYIYTLQQVWDNGFLFSGPSVTQTSGALYGEATVDYSFSAVFPGTRFRLRCSPSSTPTDDGYYVTVRVFYTFS